MSWVLGSCAAGETPGAVRNRPLVMAHYMPWYVAKPISPAWGWHWTMNHFDPDQTQEGRRPLASHFYPSIGPYDSSDHHVLEYHLLLMKLAGIDGVVVDWYGLESFRDYPVLHRNSERLMEQSRTLGMKFAVCYEDQVIPALVKARKLEPAKRVAHVVRELNWLGDHWFKESSYLRLDGNPVLLSFGQTGLSDSEWSSCLRKTKERIAYFSEHQRRTAAVGAFDWPSPAGGIPATGTFLQSSRSWKHAIPVAFPRFVDIYAEAQVHKSWGRIADDEGKTFRTTLAQALNSKAWLVQLATWNDWGEGTMIEPSREFGNRDLKIVQELVRPHRSGVTLSEQSLGLPVRLLSLRRKKMGSVSQLDRVRDLLANRKIVEASSLIRSLEKAP